MHHQTLVATEDLDCCCDEEPGPINCEEECECSTSESYCLVFTDWTVQGVNYGTVQVPMNCGGNAPNFAQFVGLFPNGIGLDIPFICGPTGSVAVECYGGQYFLRSGASCCGQATIPIPVVPAINIICDPPTNEVFVDFGAKTLTPWIGCSYTISWTGATLVTGACS